MSMPGGARSRNRPGPITKPYMSSRSASYAAATPPQKLSIETFLDQIKAGYSRFASAFKDVGYEDVADLIVEPFPAQQLPAFLGNVGAHPPQITRISTALCTIGGLTTDPNPNRGLPVGPSAWLDSIQPGYGSRFGPAFAEAGYEHVEDVQCCSPDSNLLHAILSNSPKPAAKPQLQRIEMAVQQLARNIRPHRAVDSNNHREGAAAAPSSALGSPPPPLPPTTASSTTTAATVITPHKYVTAGRQQQQQPPPPRRDGPSGPYLEPLAAEPNANASEEVQSIMAAADAERAAVIAEAHLHAEATLAQTQANAVQLVETTSMHASSSLPAAPTIKPLLPDNKHFFLSYQWDVQSQVVQVKELLNERNVKCWMDIDGGMKSDIYDSMAEGVQGAACIICFMTQAYQDSANCKLELKFAQQSGVPIIPVMMQANFTAKGWLGILTSGSIWTPMYDRASVLDGADKLIAQAQHLVPGMRKNHDFSDEASEASTGAGESFDVRAWGDDMFSLDEMREELDRLREETAPSFDPQQTNGGGNRASGASLCMLPAMVPTLPRGLFVTSEMQSVLDAVLSAKSTPQVGFCGMGGIGKTTVSCWITRNDAVRTKFGMVAWITLGQAPVLASCIDLLHHQLTGAALSDGLSSDQKHEYLKRAFRNKSVLLILDDCWDAEVAKEFTWIDHATNSKILISSRVRDVLDGGQIIDVALPSESDAAKMLLNVAGMDVGVLKERAEVAHVAELCKRLPLTIGVAGKLIRQLAQGSSMSEASDWMDVVTLLEEELDDPDGTLSIEESVIRASIKAIPTRIQRQVTQLFLGFALVPEDTHVPLPVLGMIYQACSDQAAENKSGKSVKELSRLQVRQYLKVLIDRSLVLGTVDRPQLHDVMLDYVQKQLVGDHYKAAQRLLVEALRKTDRSTTTSTGKYIQQCVRYHITESYDAIWGLSRQAIGWLEDHVNGVQDLIAASAASTIPTEVLAKEATDAGLWWQAALRWNAFGLMKKIEYGNNDAGRPYFRLAVAASAKATATSPQMGSGTGAGASDGTIEELTQFDLDSFDLFVLNLIFKAWNKDDLAIYGDRFRQVLTTKAGQSRPLLCYSARMSLDWFPAILSGNEQRYADECWKMVQMVIDLEDVSTEVYALSAEEDRTTAKPLLAWPLWSGGDAVMNSPGFSWACFGHNGDKLVDCQKSYNYERDSKSIVNIVSSGLEIVIGATPFILTLQFGRFKDSIAMLDENLAITKKHFELPQVIDFIWAAAILPTAYHIHGLSQHVRANFDMLGITFNNAEEVIDKVTRATIGSLFAGMEQKGPGGGIVSLKRCVWQVKAMYILNLDVPKATAVAWLESLPDKEGILEYSLTMPTHDHGALFGCYQSCWLALAHEKVGLYEGAFLFADLQLDEPLKTGRPTLKWPQVIALSCKGRILAQMNRHDEALAAFKAAIVVSKETYSLVEAFALRELVNYTEGGGGDAAAHAKVQAGTDLELKLETFKGRLTRAEFDTLRFTR